MFSCLFAIVLTLVPVLIFMVVVVCLGRVVIAAFVFSIIVVGMFRCCG